MSDVENLKPWETETAPEHNETLLGSNVQPAEFEFPGGATATLGQVVAHAHTLSGLSVEDWNAQSDEDREAKIQAAVDVASEPAPLTLDGLKTKATELGVQFAANIGEDTLKARIAEAEEAATAVANAGATNPPLDTQGENTTVPDNFKSTDRGQDGTVEEQEERANASKAVLGGEQASIALTNMVSRGMSMAEARKKLAAASK